MTRVNSALLDNGDQFPEMDLKLVTGETLRLPQAFGGCYSVVLFYRGHW